MNEENKKAVEKLNTMGGWEIIADNAGGLTLSINDGEYQHYYLSPAQLYDDLHILAARGIESVSVWGENELNEGEDPLTPSDEEIQNGGYQVFDIIVTPDEYWGLSDKKLWELFAE